MAFYVSEAVHDEAGRLGWEGLSVAGDQYDTEVITRQISASNEKWEYVYRPKDDDKAYMIGETAYQCSVINCGYDQSNRLSLYNAWKALPDNDKNLMNIKDVPLECDCSSMAAVCCLNAGIKVDPNMRTVIEDSMLMGTGEFEKLFYNQGMKLYKGDILLRKGHTGVVSKSDDVKPVLFIGELKKYSGVYKTPRKSIGNHIKEWPFVAKGNRVKVLKTVHGKKHVFYLCDVAGNEGYILKTRVKEV